MSEARRSEIARSLLGSPSATIATLVLAMILFCASFAPVLVAQNPFDPQQLNLLNSRIPPVWMAGGSWEFPLGTDEQGRDVLAALFYGARLSLIVGGISVVLSLSVGVALGLLAGYFGSWPDILITRLADLQMTIPGLLVALLLAGVIRTQLIGDNKEFVMIVVVVLAIGFSDWPRYTRVTRVCTMVEAREEYVSAARVMGVPTYLVLWRHILPNILRPNIVLATVGLGIAILLEATLSFLGAGIPPSTPSLGTLIRSGSGNLFSGEWWTVIFPGLTLALIVFAVNALGDWLRDTLDPMSKIPDA